MGVSLMWSFKCTLKGTGHVAAFCIISLSATAALGKARTSKMKKTTTTKTFVKTFCLQTGLCQLLFILDTPAAFYLRYTHIHMYTQRRCSELEEGPVDTNSQSEISL